MKELTFYKTPFKTPTYGSWVYDRYYNFVFQFAPKFTKKGDFVEGEEQMMKRVIDSLNSIEHKPIEELNLSVKRNYSGMIFNNNEPFILIRGWGNLTGAGAHNFPAEKAAKIQDDFMDWILYKLSK